MPIDAQQILAVLDRCSKVFEFPILDKGYWYLAASRLSLFRSPEDWAIVIETFGYSPRAGLPDTTIATFASTLCRQNDASAYRSLEDYERYLANHRNSDLHFIDPIGEGAWQGEFDEVAQDATELQLRGQKLVLPALEEYAHHGIALEDPPRVQAFELCRLIAETARDAVLATAQERRVHLLPSMTQILQLEEWHHPDRTSPDLEEMPSHLESFQQLAEVLATGNTDLYHPSQRPNTHWKNWPEGGTL